MTLKLLADNTTLRLPERDKVQQELHAWKALAIARGVMLNPRNHPESRQYSLAFEDAMKAIKVLKELKDGE